MLSDQNVLVVTICVLVGLLIWGRWRYDAVAAALSSFMNNIGAMAILLPVTIAVCQQNKWNPPKFLMPLAFASILGGMNTMIGTPPNIIISQYRETYTGTSFNFFDFSFVGVAVSLLGVVFIAFLGYRLVKVRQEAGDEIKLIDLKNYLTKALLNYCIHFQ